MEGVECKVCKNEFERTEEGGCKVKNCLNQINGRCQKCEDRYRNMKGTCVSIASLIRPAIHRGIRVVPN